MSKYKLSKFIYKIHIYGGLYAAVFLLIAGVSALNFQHHFINTQPTFSKEYSKSINFDNTLSNDSLALSIRDSLSLWGNAGRWTFKEDTLGNFGFSIFRPGRKYDVSLNRNDSKINIIESNFAFGNILNSLHIHILARPQSWILTFWAIYAQPAIILAFFTVVISIYFWVKRSIRQKYEWYIAIVAFILSVFLILYIWQVG